MIKNDFNYRISAKQKQNQIIKAITSHGNHFIAFFLFHVIINILLIITQHVTLQSAMNTIS